LAQDLYREFRAAVDRPEEAVDLGYAALTIGLSVNPHLDIPAYLRRMDQLAREVADRRDPAGDVYHSLAALNHVLFRQHGFGGNRDDYYDPRNSFLSEVLDRKLAFRSAYPSCTWRSQGESLCKLRVSVFPGTSS